MYIAHWTPTLSSKLGKRTVAELGALLTSMEFGMLSAESVRLLVYCWLSAIANGTGTLPSLTELAWYMRTTEDKVREALAPLIAGGWICEGETHCPAHESVPQPNIDVSITVDDVVNAWNATPGLRRVKTVSGPIRDRIRIRITEHPDLDWLRELFARVSRSSFLSGKKTDFAATLDWVLGPRNLAKILAGNYDDTMPSATLLSDRAKAALARQHAETHRESPASTEPAPDVISAAIRYQREHGCSLSEAIRRMSSEQKGGRS